MAWKTDSARYDRLPRTRGRIVLERIPPEMDNKGNAAAVSTTETTPLTSGGSTCRACAITAAFFALVYMIAAIAYPPMAIPPALMACIIWGALRCAPRDEEA